MAQSEVMRLRQQIAEEYEAAERGLYGIAITAQHAFINARMQRIAQYTLELAKKVDPEEARALLLENGNDTEKGNDTNDTKEVQG